MGLYPNKSLLDYYMIYVNQIIRWLRGKRTYLQIMCFEKSQKNFDIS